MHFFLLNYIQLSLHPLKYSLANMQPNSQSLFWISQVVVDVHERIVTLQSLSVLLDMFAQRNLPSCFLPF